jgi:hypothetical protein
MLQLDVFTAVLNCFVLFFDGVQQGRRQLIVERYPWFNLAVRERLGKKQLPPYLPKIHHPLPPLTYF